MHSLVLASELPHPLSQQAPARAQECIPRTLRQQHHWEQDWTLMSSGICLLKKNRSISTNCVS